MYQSFLNRNEYWTKMYIVKPMLYKQNTFRVAKRSFNFNKQCAGFYQYLHIAQENRLSIMVEQHLSITEDHFHEAADMATERSQSFCRIWYTMWSMPHQNDPLLQKQDAWAAHEVASANIFLHMIWCRWQHCPVVLYYKAESVVGVEVAFPRNSTSWSCTEKIETALFSFFFLSFFHFSLFGLLSKSLAFWMIFHASL